mgnify:CR=1 FL=1
MWQMGGIFEKNGNENEIVFKNEYGMTTKVEEEISLNILEKTY